MFSLDFPEPSPLRQPLVANVKNLFFAYDRTKGGVERQGDDEWLLKDVTVKVGCHTHTHAHIITLAPKRKGINIRGFFTVPLANNLGVIQRPVPPLPGRGLHHPRLGTLAPRSTQAQLITPHLHSLTVPLLLLPFCVYTR